MSREPRSTEQLDELERLLQFCEVQAVRSGAPLPLGAHMRGNGVNFAIFSRHATGVRLDLFSRAEDTAPARSMILDAARNKTGDIWHVWLEGIRPGNNNAYCQDNETSWVDWSLVERHRDLVRFTREAFAFRRTHAVLRQEAFYTDRDIEWFDPTGRSPDWLDPSQKRLACLVHGQEGLDLYLMFNADTDPSSFVLPQLARSGRWRLAIDTAQPSAWDLNAAEPGAGVVSGTLYAVGSRSSAILVATVPHP